MKDCAELGATILIWIFKLICGPAWFVGSDPRYIAQKCTGSLGLLIVELPDDMYLTKTESCVPGKLETQKIEALRP